MNSAASIIRNWREDPVEFVRREFKVEPDEWQKEFLINYNDNPLTAAKACKGPGKTAVLAWCAWHFLATRPFAKMAATSISGDNLRDGLWAEMAKWQQRSPFLIEAFEWTANRIFAKDHKETWFMSARRWSKDATGEQQANTLAGLHADYIMFILDEAGGIPDAVMAAAEAILASGIECKILMCGNPTHLSGPLYRACTSEASKWKVIEITGDPDNPMRSPRISKEWARDMIRKYGRENPWVLVNVFGRFPPSSMNSLVGPDDMEAAMRRIIPPEAYYYSPKILGIDVALEGDDRTVIMPRQGIAMFQPKILREPNPKEIAGHVAVAAGRWGPDAINIDNTGGFGSGVASYLEDWGHRVNRIHFSGKSGDAAYYRKRDEMGFKFALWIKNGGALPYIPELKEEAVAITYHHKDDKLKLAPKDEIKDQIGRSPDIWDAGGLTFAIPVAKRDPLEMFRNKEHGTDYDPISRALGRQDQSEIIADYNPIQ